ncbi:DUF222 domain-containing protein, partial [Saccharomonospora halophila]|uniref:DUF222 domain-containing protein n=1 Tax=Saccharomonospora halophila TaxID=129922 RepID=UPI0005853F43
MVESGEVDADEGPLVRVRELGEQRARIEAEQLRQIATWYRGCTGVREAAAELALLLSISEHHARRRLDLAITLVTRLPHTLAAMEAGTVDEYKASKVAEPTACLPDETARAVDRLVAGHLAGRDPGTIRRRVHRVVARLDPHGAADRA